MPKEKSYSCRNACATIYEVSLDELLHKLQEWTRITYAVVGREICPQTERPHLQCYFEFKNTMEQSTFTNKLGMPVYYFKARTGTAEQAADYCKKDGDFTEWGEISHQGQRTDLAECIDDIKTGMSEAELSLKHPTTFCHHMKWVQRMIELHSHPVEKAYYPLSEMCQRIQQRPIPFSHPDWCGAAVVQGGPGIGKTQYALAHFSSPLFVTHMDRLKFFDPNVHDGIVFDDMSFTHMPLQAQKFILDWSNTRDMNVKYGMATIPKNTKKIFTCNYGEFPFDRDNTAVMDRIFHLECDPGLESQRKMPKPMPYTPFCDWCLR